MNKNDSTDSSTNVGGETSVCVDSTHMRLLKDLRVAQENLSQMTRQRNELFEQLHKHTGVKSQIRMLLGAIYDKAYAAADNVNRPIRTVNAPRINLENNLDKDQLERVVLAYDSTSLTEKRLVGSFSRRVVSMLLKKTMLLGVRISKLSLKFLWRVFKRTKKAIS